jgi:hypothetical protein
MEEGFFFLVVMGRPLRGVIGPKRSVRPLYSDEINERVKVGRYRHDRPVKVDVGHVNCDHRQCIEPSRVKGNELTPAVRTDNQKAWEEIFMTAGG